MQASNTTPIEQLRAAERVITQQAERITQQAEQITQQAEQINTLSEQNELLAAQVQVLTEKLGQNSSNSSKPPSSDSPSQRKKNRQKRKRREKKRKRGGQPKHKGNYRKLLPIESVDKFVHLFPTMCEHCCAELPEVLCKKPKRYQCVDLVRGGVCVTEYQRHRVACPECGKSSLAPYDERIPRKAFSPRLTSIVSMLTGVYHLSRRQVKQLMDELWATGISLGTISTMEKRVSDALVPEVQQIKKQADAAVVKHTDGTSWRQGSVSLQLWTVATKVVTVFCIVNNGSAETLKGLFGRIKGILVSDRAKALNFWAMKQRQICWAHLLRKFVSFSQRDGPHDDDKRCRKLGTELCQYAAVVFDTYRAWTDGAIDRQTFVGRMAPVREQFDKLLQRCCDADIERFSGSCKDILAHKDALWTFVDRPDVEPTNNHAERQLRAFVLWRKKSFGTQSERGNRFAERIMTVAYTWRKQRKPLLSTLTQLVHTQTERQSSVVP